MSVSPRNARAALWRHSHNNTDWEGRWAIVAYYATVEGAAVQAREGHTGFVDDEWEEWETWAVTVREGRYFPEPGEDA